MGVIDGDVEKELRKSIRKAARYELTPDGRADLEDLEEMWQAELERCELLTVLSIASGTVRLERDICSVDERRSGR